MKKTTLLVGVGIGLSALFLGACTDEPVNDTGQKVIEQKNDTKIDNKNEPTIILTNAEIQKQLHFESGTRSVLVDFYQLLLWDLYNIKQYDFTLDKIGNTGYKATDFLIYESDKDLDFYYYYQLSLLTQLEKEDLSFLSEDEQLFFENLIEMYHNLPAFAKAYSDVFVEKEDYFVTVKEGLDIKTAEHFMDLQKQFEEKIDKNKHIATQLIFKTYNVDTTNETVQAYHEYDALVDYQTKQDFHNLLQEFNSYTYFAANEEEFYKIFNEQALSILKTHYQNNIETLASLPNNPFAKQELSILKKLKVESYSTILTKANTYASLTDEEKIALRNQVDELNQLISDYLYTDLVISTVLLETETDKIKIFNHSTQHSERGNILYLLDSMKPEFYLKDDTQ